MVEELKINPEEDIIVGVAGREDVVEGSCGGDESLLFFFLLLALFFQNGIICVEKDSLLFFFLLLAIIMGGQFT